jgi:hypothetical protein
MPRFAQHYILRLDKGNPEQTGTRVDYGSYRVRKRAVKLLCSQNYCCCTGNPGCCADWYRGVCPGGYACTFCRKTALGM